MRWICTSHLEIYGATILVSDIFAQIIMQFCTLSTCRTHVFQVSCIVLQLYLLAHAVEEMVQHTLLWMHPFVKAVIHSAPKPQGQKERELKDLLYFVACDREQLLFLFKEEIFH